jgi:hypothetical protein
MLNKILGRGLIRMSFLAHGPSGNIVTHVFFEGSSLSIQAVVQAL